jgi:hypothetical protein
MLVDLLLSQSGLQHALTHLRLKPLERVGFDSLKRYGNGRIFALTQKDCDMYDIVLRSAYDPEHTGWWV